MRDTLCFALLVCGFGLLTWSAPGVWAAAGRTFDANGCKATLDALGGLDCTGDCPEVGGTGGTAACTEGTGNVNNKVTTWCDCTGFANECCRPGAQKNSAGKWVAYAYGKCEKPGCPPDGNCAVRNKPFGGLTGVCE